MSMVRRRFYIDPEMQFPLILSFILLVTLESFFVGWGFYKLIAIAKEWDRPNQALAFFAVLGSTIVPVVVCNFLLGVWLSHKIAGPLVHMRHTMSEITRGNLEVDVQLRKGDSVRAPVEELNTMTQTLRRLIYRDYGYAQEANDRLSDCEKMLSQIKGIDAKVHEELNWLLDDAKAKLSIINAHFMKGRKEKMP